jgi:predicted nucleic acid-binding protein
MKVYLDVCCLNRPFDDLSQPRVAIEAAAVSSLLHLIDSKRVTDYSSEMARIEVERMSDADRRRKVIALFPPLQRIIPLSDDLLDAATGLIAMGFELADAVHLASARRLEIDALVTVDDKLLKRAARHSGAIGVRVVDPVTLVKELADVPER